MGKKRATRGKSKNRIVQKRATRGRAATEPPCPRLPTATQRKPPTAAARQRARRAARRRQPAPHCLRVHISHANRRGRASQDGGGGTGRQQGRREGESEADSGKGGERQNATGGGAAGCWRLGDACGNGARLPTSPTAAPRGQFCRPPKPMPQSDRTALPPVACPL